MGKPLLPKRGKGAFEFENGILYYDGEQLRKNSFMRIVNKYYEDYHNCMTAAGQSVDFTIGRELLINGETFVLVRIKGRTIYLHNENGDESTTTYQMLIKSEAKLKTAA